MLSPRALIFVVCAAFAVQAGAEITFYDREDLRGRPLTIDRPVGNFGAYGYNDRAGSIAVQSGTWQVCTDADYRGRCVTLTPGTYPSLIGMGLTNQISSARELRGAVAPPPPPPQPPMSIGPLRGRIVLFEASDFRGRSFIIERDIVNMGDAGFNDQASSAIVEEGTWQLCQHAEFRGTCVTYGPGRYTDLGEVNGLSSLRLVASAPPVPMPAPAPRAVMPAPAPPVIVAGRAILFAERGLQGRAFILDRPIFRNLAEFGFNDRASSLRVESGYWMFCSDAQFEGECRTFGPGDYPTLPPELRNSISSGRRIADRYPYRERPTWGGY